MSRFFYTLSSFSLALALGGCTGDLDPDAGEAPRAPSDTDLPDFEVSEGAELRNSCSDIGACLSLCSGVAGEGNAECVEWCVDTHVNGDRVAAPESMGCVQQCHPSQLGTCLPWCASTWDVEPGDLDGDGRPDAQDGCPREYNPYALDWDYDGQEDACQRFICAEDPYLDGCPDGDTSQCHLAARTYLEEGLEWCSANTPLASRGFCLRYQLGSYRFSAAQCDYWGD